MIATSRRLFGPAQNLSGDIDVTQNETEAWSHRSKIIMSVAVSQRHHEHCSSIATLCDLDMVCTLSLRPCYDQLMRFRGNCATCLYLGIVNLGASAILLLHSLRSGQLKASFECSPKVGVALLDSETNSEQFHSHVIDE